MSAFGRGQVGRGLLIGLATQPENSAAAAPATQAAVGRARPAPPSDVAPGPAPAAFGRGSAAFGRGVGPIASVSASGDAAAAPPTSAFGRGFGRGTAPPAAAAAGLPEAMGRLSVQGPPAAAEARPERVRRPRVERVGPDNKQGTSGQRITVGTNFLRVEGADCIVYQYNVVFNPFVDSRFLRDRLVLAIQHPDFLSAPGRVPSGNSLYTNKALPFGQSGVFQATHGNTRVSIRLDLVGTCTMSSLPSVYNIIFRSIQARMDLIQFGKHYFNPRASEKVRNQNMEVWPGYITSVSRVDAGLRLMVECNHRVVRSQTVYELFQILGNDLAAMNDAIVGTSVVTRYNNRIVRVDQIDTSLDCTHTFERNGAQVSFAQYYKDAYNIIISDPHQPLLISRAKPIRGKDGKTLEQRQVCLVPELCYVTGLTDDMRRNFQFMRELAKYTKLEPERRLEELRKFARTINGLPNCRKLLEDWGMRLHEEPDVIQARRFVQDVVQFGGPGGRVNAVPVGQTSEFKRALADNRVLVDGQLRKWLVVYPKREERTVSAFFDTMMKKCRSMGITINQPNTVGLPNDNTTSYLQAIRENFATDLDLVCAVFTSQREERYNAVKKLCCTDMVVPTQCLWTKTIGDPKKMGSVAVNVAAQMNVKLGGALWGIVIPYERFMMVGIDVYHADKARTKSATGIVASVDQACTRWYSRVAFQRQGKEILDAMRVMFQSQLMRYAHNVGALPNVIFIYRDGVSDKQIAEVQQQEVPAIYQAIQSVDANYKPKLVFVVVQKRINQRIFLRQGNAYANPPPGTVLDHSITRPDMLDFFLVPQHVTQGTVTPTHYIVVEVAGAVPVDEVQQLTFRSCHLYYNWAGSIRVPAPCQYAHKLVYLVGQNLSAEPSDAICDRLFYL